MLSHTSLPARSGKKKKRVGRGNASSGNYSGRGMKGQRSRSGGKGGLKLRGLKQSMMAVPKVAGFRSHHPAFQEVNLHQLDSVFASGDTVDVVSLKKKKLIDDIKKSVKILGNGKLEKVLTVKVHAASAGAKKSIEAAGGTFEIVVTQRSEKAEKKAKKQARANKNV